MSNNLSYYLTDNLINHFLGKTAYTEPTVYLGLSSTTPTVSGTNITEPSGGSYARVATSGATWNSAASGSTTNASTITWPTATADWLSQAPLTDVVLYDAATSGNFLGFGVMSVSKAILNGDVASIPAGSLTVTLS